MALIFTPWENVLEMMALMFKHRENVLEIMTLVLKYSENVLEIMARIRSFVRKGNRTFEESPNPRTTKGEQK